jgi:hypothetical protein
MRLSLGLNCFKSSLTRRSGQLGSGVDSAIRPNVIIAPLNVKP